MSEFPKAFSDKARNAYDAIFYGVKESADSEGAGGDGVEDTETTDSGIETVVKITQ